MSIERSEILFLYDIENNNPNGDPLDSNKPRMDEETGHNLVTDVRLKRTVRDYLMNYKGFNGKDGKDIFVRTLRDEKGMVQTGIERAGDFQNDAQKILATCIDIRLFGGVLPLKEDSITFTGPVQFKMGRSLHRMEVQYIKGTGAFASKEERAKQKTFREEYILPYSLICFYGVINENSAKETKLTEQDIKLLLEGIWEGTKNLNTRTKIGQTPRLLLKINYMHGNFHIGELDKFLSLQSELDDLKLRSIEDLVLDIEKLAGVLSENEKRIESVEYKIGKRLPLSRKVTALFSNMKEIQYNV